MIKYLDINGNVSERNWYIPYSCRCNAISGSKVIFGDKPENVGCAVIAEKDTRRRIINGVWEFAVPNDNHKTKCSIPMNLACDKKVVFSRSFKIPYAVSLKDLFVVFDGIDSGATVKINDNVVGNTDSVGSWEFSISPYIKDGINEISVEFDAISHGIFGEVYILDRPKSHIVDYFLDVKADSIYVAVSANKEYGAVTLELYDADNTLVSRADSVVKDYKANIKMNVNAPILWNAERPYLYTLLIHGFNEVIPVRFGFREYECKDKAFYVNGKETRLVKCHNTGIRNDRGIPFFDIYKKLADLKQNNINCIEIDSSSYNHRLVSLADELGFYAVDSKTSPSVEAFRDFKNEFARVKVTPNEIRTEYQVYNFENCFDFTNLDDFDVLYEIKTPSKTYLSGRLDLKCEPNEKVAGRIDFLFPDFSFEEFFVEFSFRLKNNVVWAGRGFEVCYAQIKLPVIQTSPETEKSSSMPEIVCKNDAEKGKLSISGENFDYVFNMGKGSFESILFDGCELLSREACFCIENLHGVNRNSLALQGKFDDINILSVKSAILSQGREYITILSSFAIKDKEESDLGMLSVLWAIYGSGEIGVGLTGEFFEEIDDLNICFNVNMKQHYSTVKYYGLEKSFKVLAKEFLCRKGIYSFDLKDNCSDDKNIMNNNFEYVQWATIADEFGTGILIKGMPSFGFDVKYSGFYDVKDNDNDNCCEVYTLVKMEANKQFFGSFTFKPVNVECIDLLRETRTLPGINEGVE